MQTKIEDLLRRRNEMLAADHGAGGASSAVDNSVDFELRISDAHRKMDTTRKKFEKLRTVCISAEQGLKSMLDRVKVALQEVTAAELVPVSCIPHGTPPRPGKKALDRRERYPPLSSYPTRTPRCPSGYLPGQRAAFPWVATL